MNAWDLPPIIFQCPKCGRTVQQPRYCTYVVNMMCTALHQDGCYYQMVPLANPMVEAQVRKFWEDDARERDERTRRRQAAQEELESWPR